jgi:hypothetical protein
VPQSLVLACDVATCSCIDWTLHYIEEELREFNLKHINLREFPNHNDSALMSKESNPRITDKVIKKGQLYESLEPVKFFSPDYLVRHHRSFYVAK